MAFTYTHLLLILFLTATLLAVGEATRNIGGGWPPNRQTPPQNSSKIIVGGNQKWRFGFNYTDWSIKKGPFYVNDTLVFKYAPPSNGTFPHNVYLLRNYRSFLKCDLKKAKQVASVTQGVGEGFKFKLKKRQPYYFACGIGNGTHCNFGLMKFTVTPIRRWRI